MIQQTFSLLYVCLNFLVIFCLIFYYFDILEVHAKLVQDVYNILLTKPSKNWLVFLLCNPIDLLLFSHLWSSNKSLFSDMTGKNQPVAATYFVPTHPAITGTLQMARWWQCCEAGSKFDPHSATLRIRIGADPSSEYGSRSTQLKIG